MRLIKPFWNRGRQWPRYKTINKAISVILIGAVPLMVWGHNVLQGQMNALIFCMFLAGVLLMPNIWLKALGFLAVGWLGYAYLAGFVGLFPSGAYVDASLQIMLGLAFLLFVFHSDISFETYAGVICVSALFQATLGICQWAWFDPVSSLLVHVVNVTGGTDHRTAIGTLGNPNFLGAYLAISLPFFFRRGWAWFIPVFLLGLYAADAMSAIGAAIIGAAYYFGGWRGAIIGIVPAGIYYLTLSEHSLLHADRYAFWFDAIRKVSASKTSLLFGYGQGVTWQVDNQLHSEYAATLFAYGMTGLAAMIGYIAMVYRDHRILFTAFLILCINMIGNHPLHTVPTAILIITIIGLIERERKRELAPSQAEPVY